MEPTVTLTAALTKAALTSVNKMKRSRQSNLLLSLLNPPHASSVAFSLFSLPPSAIYEVSLVWNLIPLYSGNLHSEGRMHYIWSKIIFHRIRMEACS